MSSKTVELIQIHSCVFKVTESGAESSVGNPPVLFLQCLSQPELGKVEDTWDRDHSFIHLLTKHALGTDSAKLCVRGNQTTRCCFCPPSGSLQPRLGDSERQENSESK